MEKEEEKDESRRERGIEEGQPSADDRPKGRWLCLSSCKARSYELLNRMADTDKLDPPLHGCAVGWWLVCVTVIILMATYTLVTALERRAHKPVAVRRVFRPDQKMPNLVVCNQVGYNPTIAALIISYKPGNEFEKDLVPNPPVNATEMQVPFDNSLCLQDWICRRYQRRLFTPSLIVAQNLSAMVGDYPFSVGIKIYPTGAPSYEEFLKHPSGQSGRTTLLSWAPMTGNGTWNYVTYSLTSDSKLHFPFGGAYTSFSQRWQPINELVPSGPFSEDVVGAIIPAWGLHSYGFTLERTGYRRYAAWFNVSYDCEPETTHFGHLTHNTDGCYTMTDNFWDIYAKQLPNQQPGSDPAFNFTEHPSRYAGYYTTLVRFQGDEFVTRYMETDPFNVLTVLGAIGGYLPYAAMLFGLVFVLKQSGLRQLHPSVAKAWQKLHQWCTSQQESEQERSRPVGVRSIVRRGLPPPPEEVLLLTGRTGATSVHDKMLHHRIAYLESKMEELLAQDDTQQSSPPV